MKELEIYLTEGEEILNGKKEQLILALSNFLAGGHTLIEDAPGVGKTTLVKFFSEIFELKLSRIQFTNDLLPADIIGNSIFNKKNNEFMFHQGPIFGEIIMADELNRAPPKTQSALLQAMEEKHITIDGNTYTLPEHFHVIATQNPHTQIGTFDLPESQLDRFSLKMDIGYPDKESTLKMLEKKSVNPALRVAQTIGSEWIGQSKLKIDQVYFDKSLYEYIYALLNNSRSATLIPLSNRCGLDLVKVSKAYAFLNQQKNVTPENIQYLFPYVAGHRLVHPGESNIGIEADKARQLIEQTSLRP